MARSVADEIGRLKRTLLDDPALLSQFSFDPEKDRVGSGAYGTVFRATDKDGNAVCIKKLSASSPNLPSDPLQRARALFQEVELLRILNSPGKQHPNILRFLHAFEDHPPSSSGDLVHITEFCGGGDLFSVVVKRMNGGRFYSEVDAARVVALIAGALHHLHSLGFLHRDLKLENILLRTAAPSASASTSDSDDDLAAALVLADLGICLMKERPDPFHGLTVGTFALTAPEVLLYRQYSEASDTWSLGCLLYILLVGTMPFGRAATPQEYQAVLSGIVYWDTYFPPNVEAGLSDGAKEVIRGMLRKNPRERMTIPELLLHPWIKAATAPPPVAQASQPASTSAAASGIPSSAATAPLLPLSTYHNLVALDLERRAGAAAHSVILGSAAPSPGGVVVAGGGIARAASVVGGFSVPASVPVPVPVPVPALRRALTTLSPIPSEGADSAISSHSSEVAASTSTASPLTAMPFKAQLRAAAGLPTKEGETEGDHQVSLQAFEKAMKSLFAVEGSAAGGFSWPRVFSALDKNSDGIIPFSCLENAAVALSHPFAEPVVSSTAGCSSGLELIFAGLGATEAGQTDEAEPAVTMGALIGLLSAFVQLKPTGTGGEEALMTQLEAAWPGYSCGNFSVAPLQPPAPVPPTPPAPPAAAAAASLSTAPPAFYLPAEQHQNLVGAAAPSMDAEEDGDNEDNEDEDGDANQSSVVPLVGGRKRRRFSADLEIGETRERTADIERRRLLRPQLSLAPQSTSASAMPSPALSSRSPVKKSAVSFANAHADAPAVVAASAGKAAPAVAVAAAEEEPDTTGGGGRSGVDVAVAILSLQRLFTQLSVVGSSSGIGGGAGGAGGAGAAAAGQGQGQERKRGVATEAAAATEGAGAMPVPAVPAVSAAAAVAFSDIRVTCRQFKLALGGQPALLALLAGTGAGAGAAAR